MAIKCPKCNGIVTILPTQMAMCHTCGITARTVEDWINFTKKTEEPDWEVFYNELTSVVSALVGLVALSDDEGIVRLAGGTLIRLNKLDFSEFFTNKKEAKEHERRLKDILEKTGAANTKRIPIPRD